MEPELEYVNEPTTHDPCETSRRCWNLIEKHCGKQKQSDRTLRRLGLTADAVKRMLSDPKINPIAGTARQCRRKQASESWELGESLAGLFNFQQITYYESIRSTNYFAIKT